VSTSINTESAALIRDLSDQNFAAKYDCSRLDATVLASRFRYIVQHMCTGLLEQAFSPILRDWYDFAGCVTGPRELDYAMPAVSNSLMLFLGTMAEATRNTVEEYGPDKLQRGDVLIGNDPYRVGTHPNDVCFIRPIFADSDTPVCFLTLRVHVMDVGGVVPAGFSGTKRNVFENGIVLSPRLLYRNDEPVLETWNLFFDNTRFADVLIADITGAFSSLRLGERLLEKTIRRYGVDAVHGTMRYACDASAETMFAAIAELPDGVYEGEDGIDADAVDSDEEYRVRVKVIVRGGRIELDFSGTSRQARTSVNSSWLDTKTAVSIALMYLFSSDVPFTSGALREVDIVLPDGTFISALPPDGPVFVFFDAEVVTVSAIFRALADALGPRAVGGDFGSLSLHNANGLTEDGTPWVSIAQLGGEHGPWAGTAVGDGDSYTVFYPANNMDPATEAIEADTPVVVLRKEYATDTAGPGLHRGGAAVAHDTLYLTDGEHFSMPMHFRTPSGFGVYGGDDGGIGGVWMWQRNGVDEAMRTAPSMEGSVYADSSPIAGTMDPQTLAPAKDGVYHWYAAEPLRHTRPAAIFRYITNGGGGWGDPLDRAPGDVLDDVRDEYVSIAGARADYGVVVSGDPHADPEGLALDLEATEALRREVRGARADG